MIWFNWNKLKIFILEKIEKVLCQEIVECFDFFKNVESLFKIRESSLNFTGGIRALSFFWVVFGIYQIFNNNKIIL